MEFGVQNLQALDLGFESFEDEARSDRSVRKGLFRTISERKAVVMPTLVDAPFEKVIRALELWSYVVFILVNVVRLQWYIGTIPDR